MDKRRRLATARRVERTLREALAEAPTSQQDEMLFFLVETVTDLVLALEDERDAARDQVRELREALETARVLVVEFEPPRFPCREAQDDWERLICTLQGKETKS